MPILQDAIKSGMLGYGIGSLDGLYQDQLGELLSITRKQRKNWWLYRIVPHEILKFLWGLGIEITEIPPKQGMKLGLFLEHLHLFAASCKNETAKQLSDKLYLDTVKFELMPYWRHKIKPRKPRYRYENRIGRNSQTVCG